MSKDPAQDATAGQDPLRKKRKPPRKSLLTFTIGRRGGRKNRTADAS